MGTFVSSRQVRQNINLMTPWWLSGASIDLDFDNQRYYDSSLGASASLAPLNSYLSISRASTGYAQDSSGTWVAFGNDTLRITDKGLLLEDARTNYLLNSGSPATQTTASLSTGSYTLWVEGSGSATPSAGSATITGAGPATAGTPDTFNVTVAGTVTVTVSGSLTRFQLENGSFASSWISTTGASATRAADRVDTLGSLLSIFSGSSTNSVVADTTHVLGDTGFKQIFGFPGSAQLLGIRNDDVTTYADGPDLNATLGSSRTFSGGVKAGFAQSGSARSICGGGGTVATDANAGHTVSPSLGVNSGTITWLTFRRLTAWNSKLADATLQSLTAP